MWTEITVMNKALRYRIVGKVGGVKSLANLANQFLFHQSFTLQNFTQAKICKIKIIREQPNCT